MYSSTAPSTKSSSCHSKAQDRASTTSRPLSGQSSQGVSTSGGRRSQAPSAAPSSSSIRVTCPRSEAHDLKCRIRGELSAHVQSDRTQAITDTLDRFEDHESFRLPSDILDGVFSVRDIMDALTGRTLPVCFDIDNIRGGTDEERLLLLADIRRDASRSSEGTICIFPNVHLRASDGSGFTVPMDLHLYPELDDVRWTDFATGFQAYVDAVRAGADPASIGIKLLGVKRGDGVPDDIDLWSYTTFNDEMRRRSKAIAAYRDRDGEGFLSYANGRAGQGEVSLVFRDARGKERAFPSSRPAKVGLRVLVRPAADRSTVRKLKDGVSSLLQTVSRSL